jgi:hypothetical protein
MKEPKGYSEAQAYTENEKLPAGGYPIKIMAANVDTYDWGEVLLIQFDISEGQYKGFYKKNYESQQTENQKWKGTIRMNLPKDDGSEKDGWTIRGLKTNMLALEESNKGFKWEWDESKLKGLSVGGLFRDKEWQYEGKTGFFTECFKLYSLEKVRVGDFKMPDTKYLNGKQSAPESVPTGMEITDEDIPFL